MTPSVELEQLDRACASCGQRGLRGFYRQPDIPSHSVLLFPSREEARDYPRGSLRLALCPRCGFIANVDVDVSLQNYSTDCEETQAASPRFRRFLEQLARDLIRRHGLHGKQILEIGSGKAEFLALLCNLGDNRGVGVDPAGIPERLDAAAAERVRLIQDYYSERYAGLPADVVACRHTLEHIPATGAFLRLIRSAIGDRSDTLVFFELPDVGRVLREGAFWDVYYEHCSYFTPGSLARLFRLAGFEVGLLELAYDDQYILLEARPAASGAAAAPPLQLEEDPEQVAADVERFREAVGAAAAHWGARMRQNAEAGRRTVVWGSGSKGVAFLTTLDQGGHVEYVVDINARKQGKFMPGTGQEVVAPAFLAEYRPDLVVVMNPIYREEIAAQLASLGVAAELAAV